MPDEKKNLAFIFWARDRYGGAERRYARLAKDLLDSGEANVTVICPPQFRDSLKRIGIEIPETNVRLFRIGTESGLSFLTVSGLVKMLFAARRSGVSHVHICSNPGLISFVYSVFSRWLPRFSISMNAGHFAFKASKIQKILFTPVTVRKCFAVDCLSNQTRDALASFLPSDLSNRLIVAPCSFTDYSKIHKVAKRDIDVAFMSRFVQGKGINLLEQVMPHLESLEVHVCGFGPLKPDLPFARIYHTDNPLEVLARTRIVLSLQEIDNYPSQVVLEAMASECALIATDVGETRKFLDESCAILVPPEPKAICSAIQFLIETPDARDRLAAAGMRRAIMHHTVEKYRRYFVNEIVGN